MHDCSECFWAFHEGCAWEQAVSVAEDKRKEIRQQLQLVDATVPDIYGANGRLPGLGIPALIKCVSKLAEGGGKCWFSAIYFLLVGKKSG